MRRVIFRGVDNMYRCWKASADDSGELKLNGGYVHVEVHTEK